MVQVLTNIKLPMRVCPVLLEYKIVRISSQTLIQLRESINDAVMAIDEIFIFAIPISHITPQLKHTITP